MNLFIKSTKLNAEQGLSNVRLPRSITSINRIHFVCITFGIDFYRHLGFVCCIISIFFYFFCMLPLSYNVIAFNQLSGGNLKIFNDLQPSKIHIFSAFTVCTHSHPIELI